MQKIGDRKIKAFPPFDVKRWRCKLRLTMSRFDSRVLELVRQKL